MQRYATTAPTSLILREIARQKEIPIQVRPMHDGLSKNIQLILNV